MDGGGQCNNRFSTLRARKDVKESSDVVTGMLQVFYFDVVFYLIWVQICLLLLLILLRFDVSPEVLLRTYSVYTLIGDSVWARRV